MAESFDRHPFPSDPSLDDLFRQAPRLVASEDLWNKIATDFSRAENGAPATKASTSFRGLPASSQAALSTAKPRLALWAEAGLALAASLTLLASPWFAEPPSLAGAESRVTVHSMAADLAKANEERYPIDSETLSWLASLGELGVEDNEYTLAFQNP